MKTKAKKVCLIKIVDFDYIYIYNNYICITYAMIYYICYIVYKLCAIYNKYAIYIYIYIPGNMIYIYI